MFLTGTNSSSVDNSFLSVAVSFQQEFLKTHNDYRAAHGTSPLKFNSELTAAAQKWADHLLATGAFEHSNTKDGENIFYTYSSAGIKLTGG